MAKIYPIYMVGILGTHRLRRHCHEMHKFIESMSRIYTPYIVYALSGQHRPCRLLI